MPARGGTCQHSFCPPPPAALPQAQPPSVEAREASRARAYFPNLQLLPSDLQATLIICGLGQLGIRTGVTSSHLACHSLQAERESSRTSPLVTWVDRHLPCWHPALPEQRHSWRLGTASPPTAPRQESRIKGPRRPRSRHRLQGRTLPTSSSSQEVSGKIFGVPSAKAASLQSLPVTPGPSGCVSVQSPSCKDASPAPGALTSTWLHLQRPSSQRGSPPQAWQWAGRPQVRCLHSRGLSPPHELPPLQVS